MWEMTRTEIVGQPNKPMRQAVRQKTAEHTPEPLDQVAKVIDQTKKTTISHEDYVSLRQVRAVYVQDLPKCENIPVSQSDFDAAVARIQQAQLMYDSN